MSSPISLTVELPQYSRTFSVDVPQEGSIRDVKMAVSQACPGEPRVDGQRLIYKGRVLDDGELVQQLWREDGPRVVHLAVNPGYWSKGPPETVAVQTSPSEERRALIEEQTRVYNDSLHQMNQLQERLSSIRQTSETLVNRVRSHPMPSSTSQAPCTYPSAPQFIVHLHFKALGALSPSVQMPARALANRSDKDIAKSSVYAAGRSWPTIFDEEFPSSDGTESDGVKYNFTIIDGKAFLQLDTTEAEPTPVQRHALRVLSYTFPLLSIRVRHYSRTVIRQPHNTDVVRQPQIRALPIRALIAPLVLLGLRTLLLLYFFSPARKPLFSILLAVWVIYEGWGAVRGALLDLNDIAADVNPQHQGVAAHGAGAQGGAAGNNPNDAAGALRADHARARNGQNHQQRGTLDHILSRLARIILESEERALAAGNYVNEPGIFSYLQSFVALFVLTLHPDIWKRRRKALREREARIKAEAINRRTPSDESQTVGGGTEEVHLARQRLIETHERRRPWVKHYIRRVEEDEWVDE